MSTLHPSLLTVLATTLAEVDPELSAHSQRVAAACGTILRTLEVDPLTAARVLSSARLHDLGKLALPPGLLDKPGSLTPAERALMETHPARGADCLARVPAYRSKADIILHHHERWDGDGYPARLAGPAIPFGARVIAVADTWDALTHARPYRPAGTVAAACAILIAGSGTQWDPTLVDIWLHCVAEAGRNLSARANARAANELRAA
ncbi:MAG: HD-GYP domain-containing protein [Chloroflexia bacterium]